MRKKPLPKFASLLPQDARDALIAASQTPGSRFDRQRAVQEAIERARRRYPHLFTTTPEGVTP